MNREIKKIVVILDPVGSWIDGHKCVPVGYKGEALHEEFSGEKGYDLEKTKQVCAEACDDRDDCFFADAYFSEDGKEQTCYLRGKHCGNWHKNTNSLYHLYHKGM